MLRLVILASSVFEISCGKTRQTNAPENPTPSPPTTVGVCKESSGGAKMVVNLGTREKRDEGGYPSYS